MTAWMPPAAPLAMPTQDLSVSPHPAAPAAAPSAGPSAALAWRRALVLLATLGIAGFGTIEMAMVLDGTAAWPLEAAMLVLGFLLFCWIGVSFVGALAGFVVLWRTARPQARSPGTLRTRTALLVPVCNECPRLVFDGVAAMCASLRRAGAADSFDVFILSDTADAAAAASEHAGFLRLCLGTARGPQVHFRRRAENTGRKAGNIADWVRRQGADYDHFVILDADSVMTAQTLIALARCMEDSPRAGIIQTVPVCVGGETLFARLQQFAGRLDGVLAAAGAAWWQGEAGNYYGHNAIIRTRAFAAAAGLPRLPGPRPFGGDILSHDFIEAALIVRAGWSVTTLPLLAGSFEQPPPDMIASAARDRRWCQGNLQHAGVVAAAGLHPISRLHLAMGIFAYASAPLWLALLLLGMGAAVQASLVLPTYFPAGHTLFPEWPTIDAVRAKWVFVATMALLLLPRFLAAALFLRDADNRRKAGGAPRIFAGVVISVVVAALLAPVMMLTQARQVAGVLAGGDGGWAGQRRGGGAPGWREIAARYWGHTGLGVALSSIWWLAPSAAIWMAPVIVGLALAIPLVLVTSSAALGAACARAGLLAIPEETAPPDEIRHLAKGAAAEQGMADVPGLAAPPHAVGAAGGMVRA